MTIRTPSATAPDYDTNGESEHPAVGMRLPGGFIVDPWTASREMTPARSWTLGEIAALKTGQADARVSDQNVQTNSSSLSAPDNSESLPRDRAQTSPSTESELELLERGKELLRRAWLHEAVKRAKPMDPLEAAKVGAFRTNAGVPAATATDAVVHGAIFKWDDDIVPAVLAPIDMLLRGESFKEAYLHGRAAHLDRLEQYYKKNPSVAAAAELLGSFALAPARGRSNAVPSETHVQKITPDLIRKSIQGAKHGAITGTLSGAGNAEGSFDQRFEEGVKEGIISSAVGATVPAVLHASKVADLLQPGRMERLLELVLPPVGEAIVSRMKASPRTER